MLKAEEKHDRIDRGMKARGVRAGRKPGRKNGGREESETGKER